jgi:hypothetical protein
MIVRIDTTNLSRGREFTLFGRNPDGKPVTVRALEVSTGAVSNLVFTHRVAGPLDAYDAVAPSIDGYLMAGVGPQKVAKKIGHPVPSFVIGYRPNYTLPYRAIGADGLILGEGELLDAGEGWYWTLLPQGTAVVETIRRKFVVNENLLKMEYRVTMEGGSLGSEYLPSALESGGLPDVTLPDVTFEDATLSSTLPNITIEEL